MIDDVLPRLKAALAQRYTIERVLGSGGMATVYLAEDLKHHRKVAVKVLRSEISATLGPERFVREIEIAANLNHPHILPLHDSGEADGFLYYVMPFVEGESLRDRLLREEKLSVPDAVRITDQVASALSYAHERGVVHRDIKPENILCTDDQAIVADFGIARAVEVAGGEKLTGTGIAVGTPAYMSPEQAVGETQVDGRSDVYALGCVVYEMVAGRAPFEGETPQAMLAKHAVGTAPSLRASDPSIPLFLERAVERALAKEPADRFQSARAFGEALTSEMVVARVGRRRWPWLAISGATIALLAAVALILLNVLGGPAYERLAVLPPTNLMHDPEQEYFVQGVHNALITELQRAGITVIARTSVMQYENTQKPIREIAAELSVDALIESSVFRAGDSVVMEVRLVDGGTEQYVAEPITRGGQLRDVMALYRNLSSAIAAEIQATLTPQAEAFLASARPVNPEAYLDYLRGQFHFHLFTPSDFTVALEYFERALRRDSTYALAYAGIAMVWGIGRTGLVIGSMRENRVQAIAAARQALRFDSTLAEVQFVVAIVRGVHERDRAGAETAYERAIQLNPNYPDARAFYSQHLYTAGRREEGRAQMDSALALDPFNNLFRGMNGFLLYWDRRYEDAIAEWRRAGGGNIWDALDLNGAEAEAFAELRNWVATVEDQEVLDGIDRGYAEGGYRGACRRVADILATRGAGPSAVPATPVLVASWYASARDAERTLEWLERAYEERDLMGSMAVDPLYDFVREDPRFQDLLRRVGLSR